MLVRKSFQGLHYLSFCSLMSFEANPAELSGGSSGNEGTESEGVSQGQESGYSSFAQEVLKGVPKEHLSILEPHMKKWDAGYTRRFQDLQNQYKPYANLGWDEDTASQMAEIYRVINEDPQRLYEALKEQLGIEDAGTEAAGVQEGESDQGPFQGLPKEFVDQFTQQQKALEALAQIVLDSQKTQKESIEDKEFENYINLLKQEYGEFDEDYVCALIANGKDGEAAVKQWQSALQQALTQASQSTEGLPPAVLSSAGGGAIPQNESQNLGQIPSKDIRNLIANVMSQTHQAGQ